MRSPGDRLRLYKWKRRRYSSVIDLICIIGASFGFAGEFGYFCFDNLGLRNHLGQRGIKIFEEAIAAIDYSPSSCSMVHIIQLSL